MKNILVLIVLIAFCSVLTLKETSNIRISRVPSSIENEDVYPDDRDILQYKNIYGSGLNIDASKKEISLTLDDGPGPRTLELAKFLAKEDVPATFFMQGNNVTARMKDVQAIANLKLSNGKTAHNISNHTWNHTNIGRSSRAEAVRQMNITDKKLDQIRTDAGQTRFFRAPYGSWGSRTQTDMINGTGNLSKTVGPVFWDIGGDAKNSNYAADWACWSKRRSIASCKQGYINETVARTKQGRGGIMLVHDVHGKTIDMLMGENGLIRTLKRMGYKFVALDKDPNAVAKYQAPSTESLSQACDESTLLSELEAVRRSIK